MQALPTVQKALVLKQAGSPVVFEEVPVPVPNQDQVLIRVDSAPINPSDIGSLRGTYPGRSYPSTPGNEGAGVVVSEGEFFGKRVSFVGVAPHGTYAQFSISEKTSLIEVDDNIPLQNAANSFVNPGTVIGFLDVVKKAQVPAIVHTAAASQLGRMLVRYFKANGVHVINVVRRQEQVDILKNEGAEYVLNSSDPDFPKNLEALSAELKATIAFDAIGGEQTATILSALPNGSTIYIYGGLSNTGYQQTGALDLIFKGKQARGFHLLRWISEAPGNLAFLKQTVKENLGTFFKSEIAREFPLSQIDEAVKTAVENQTAGKIVLRPHTE